jgi:hypothetical protein
MPLFRVPPGANVRPMFEALPSMGVSLVCLVLVGAMVVAERKATLKEKAVALGVALFPLLFTVFGWQVIAAVRGFRLAE